MAKTYCYDYPHPALTTDVIVFRCINQIIHILLIKRKNDPFQGYWAFPGGFVDENEIVERSVERELLEETSLSVQNLELIFIASDPLRDPRGWSVSVVFSGYIINDNIHPSAGDDAGDVRFFEINNLPPLAFDHEILLKKAVNHLLNKFQLTLHTTKWMDKQFKISDFESFFCKATKSPDLTSYFSEFLKQLKIIIPGDDDKLFRLDVKHYHDTIENVNRFIH